MTTHLRSTFRKLTTLSLLVAFGTVLIVTQAKSEEPLLASLEETNVVSLRSDIRVDGQIITLGDLFHFSGSRSDINVVRAPKPGAKLSIPASALLRFARRQGLMWENTMEFRQVLVVRNSTRVHEDDIRDILEIAFDDMGLEGTRDIKFHGRNLTIHLPVGMVPELSVETLTHDPVSGRFTAEIRTPLDNGESMLTPVSGQTVRVELIPILARPVPRGEVLTAADVEIERIPVKRMGANVVTLMEDVVGMQTKRALRPGQPLRSTDLAIPTLVKKGALVTMTFTSPGMTLRNVGRALESGGAGDIINVINPRSRQTVMARVVTRNQVSVALNTIQIASAQ